MAWYDFLRTQREEPRREVALSEVVNNYDVVDVLHNEGQPLILVTDKGTMFNDAPVADLSEIGTSAPSPFTSHMRKEYNRDLQGLQGLQNYDRMRRSDGTVRGTLRVYKTPVLAARWFIEPGGEGKADDTAAKFVWKCLTEYMSISWPQVLTEALLMCDFGYYMFEKVWEERVIEGKERMVLKKLAPRHPMDVKEWKYDEHGGPAGVVMYVPAKDNYGQDEKFIPIDKLLVFTFDREAGNIEGISVLRSAYKHWYFKEQLYKIDAIQKERHGIGIPVIKLPPGFKPADRNAADELGRNLRTNERAHVVLPPNWELFFAKLEGQPVDAMKSIDHHNKGIRENVLAGFLGTETSTKEEDHILFLKATRFIADIVCESFNLYVIPDLMKYNFDRAKQPRLRARRIGESADWRTLSFAIRNLIGANVIKPDDELERWIRDEMDLPKPDPETVRETATPQAPGEKKEEPEEKDKQDATKNKPGLPRQSKTPPVGVPSKSAGRDESGGK